MGINTVVLILGEGVSKSKYTTYTLATIAALVEPQKSNLYVTACG